MNKNNFLSLVKKKNNTDFNNANDVKDFWSSIAIKLQIKKNINTVFSLIMDIIIIFLNLLTLALLVTIITLVINKLNSTDLNKNDTHAINIIILIGTSVFLSIFVIISTFILNSMKSKNKANTYKNICSELNYLFLKYQHDKSEININNEIEKIIQTNSIIKKEKLKDSLKKFLSEGKIKC